MHACYHRERRRRRLFRFGERRTGGGGGSVSSPSAERVGGGQRGGDGDGDMLRFIIRRSVTTSPIIIVSKSLSLASRSFNLVSVATSPRISLAWCVVSVDGCQNLSARAIAAARRVSVFRRGWSSCCSSSDAPPVAPLPLACAVRTAGVVAGPTRATAAVAAPSTSGLRARTVVGGAELPPSASASVVEATGPVLSRLVVAWHARRHASARLARRAPRGPRRRLVRVMARQPRPSPLPCTEARVEPSMSRTESASCAPSLVVTSLARTHDRRRRDRETWAVSENNSDRTKSSVVRA